MTDLPDYIEESNDEDLEEAEERPRDKAIDAARAELEKHFRKYPKDVFYLKQLIVIFERQFFHWITWKALNELVGEDKLREENGHLQSEKELIKVRFFFHPRCRYIKRPIKRKLELIRQFSSEHVGHACGRQAEMLFSRAILSKGFTLIAEKARGYKDRIWTGSGHDLDFIFERDGVPYGCEIKNRFEYIDKAEMQIKMKMCGYLGLTPLFIIRMAPKTYIEEIRQAGGFTSIFQTHIYPFGAEKLVDSIREEFQGLPVDCPSDIPNTILDRFLKWHVRKAKRMNGAARDK